MDVPLGSQPKKELTSASYFTPPIKMQTAINLTDTPRTKYNGWSDWTTWNCALWIGGDEGLYSIAQDNRTYGSFIELMIDMGMTKTPDGAKWDEADFDEMQEMMDEL